MRAGSGEAARQDPWCLSQACPYAGQKCDSSAGTLLLLRQGKGKSCLSKFSVKTLQFPANRSSLIAKWVRFTSFYRCEKKDVT